MAGYRGRSSSTLAGRQIMERVFVVQHSYTLGECEETKMIGVYSTLRRAQAAVVRLGKQPGFRRRPKCFCIGVYPLDKDHWVEGFFTSRPPQASRAPKRKRRRAAA